MRGTAGSHDARWGWLAVSSPGRTLGNEARHICAPISGSAGGLNGFEPLFVLGLSTRSHTVRLPMHFSRKSLSDRPAKHGKLKDQLFRESHSPRIAILYESVTWLIDSDWSNTGSVWRFYPESVSWRDFTGCLIMALLRHYSQRTLSVNNQREIKGSSAKV